MGTVAVNREEDVAAHAAREQLERLQDPDGFPFEHVFAAYNADPDDDPSEAAPGSTFGVAGLRLGADDFITKPFDVDIISHAVKSVLGLK